MSKGLREFLQDLRNPSKYVRVPNVTIFDEHEEEYFVDGKGKPCGKSSPGAIRKVRRFTRARLEEIARSCNRRDRTGSLSPLTFGHTDPDEPDETKQPPGVGFAHRYGVAYSDELGRHVLKTDFYIRRDKYEQSKTFPRVSVELWDKHSIVDPVALIRRTPQRDLGQWTYGRGGDVLRYSMEFSMPERYEMEDDLDTSLPNEMPDEDTLPDGPKPDEVEGGDEGMSDEEHEQYMRHCYSHPLSKKYAAHCAKKYGMPEEEPAPDAGGDPTDLPDADEQPELNFASAGAGNAMPGQKPMQHSRSDTDRVRASRRDAELEEMRKQVAISEARRWVTQLAAEGYDFNEKREVQQFARLNEEGRKAYARNIRSFYKKAPLGSSGPLVTDERDDDDPRDTDLTSKQHFARATQYARENPGTDWDECVRKTKKGAK